VPFYPGPIRFISLVFKDESSQLRESEVCHFGEVCAICDSVRAGADAALPIGSRYLAPRAHNDRLDLPDGSRDLLVRHRTMASRAANGCAFFLPIIVGENRLPARPENGPE
jgi:hypothetical protein